MKTAQAPHPFIQPDALQPGSLASARLWLPRLSLTNCVQAFMARNTHGLVLNDQQRHNYFPATPCCSITWVFSGTGELLSPGPQGLWDGPRHPMTSRTSFAGPFNQPIVTWNPGPVHALTMLLLPDAVKALTGIDPGAYLNRAVAAEDICPAEWLALSQDVFDAPDDEARLNLIQDRLNPMWQAVRPDATRGTRYVDDWARGLAMRAANSGLGRSARQIERRIKQWTGQPLRELRGISRVERAFFDSIVAEQQGPLNWTELAMGAGFSDQSHLCRQIRRITGFAPLELRRLIAQDEAFWPYRVWGFTETGQPR